MDPKRDWKIRMLRSRGKTYSDIVAELRVGRHTISKVLAMKSMESDAALNGTATTAPLLSSGQSYIREKRTIENGSAFAKVGYSTVDGDTDGIVSLNKKRTKIMGGPEGSRIVSIFNSGRSSNSHLIIGAPLLSKFGKIFFLVVGIVLLIWILKRIKGDALEGD